MSVYCTLYSEADAEIRLELERRWGVLDYLFSQCGGDHSDFLNREWEELAPEAHRIGAADAAAIATWLEATSDADFMDAFDPKAMAAAEVYGGDQLDQLGPLLESYRSQLVNDISQMRQFMIGIRQSGDNVIRVLA
ncbi:DUF1877 family protein [Parerythrobacter aestuarii]|uniref:DUF1877 family protein n=1 Tax=Parerythrobacter aestuarii TaxID=3020909 RepID=UPI0024DE2C0A|nr:DUF1877 family protein [Parerythrobacter aestuarii]